MSLEEKANGERGMREANRAEDELTPELDLALRDFRLSVHAWSEAVMNRPRQALAAAPPRQVWRSAAGWALSYLLIACAVTAGVFEHRRQPVHRAEVRLPEQPRLATETGAKPESKPPTKRYIQQARQEDEELLAKVDRDISRAVPSAMEPLGQLMAWDESEDETK